MKHTTESAFLTRHLPVYLWMGVIFFFSSLPSSALIPLPWYISRSIHFSEYCILGVLLIRSLARTRIGRNARWVLTVACCIGAVYALTDEFHQYFVPGRSAEFGDWAVDCIGVLAGVFIMKRSI